MTREQLDKLAQLLTDTAQTASTIELRALAGGRADDGIVAMAAKRRHSPRCAPTACGVSNSSRSKPSHWTATGFLRSGWTSRRRRSGEQEI